MKTDDLGALWHSASFFIVFDHARETFWLNAKAERYFRGKFKGLLIESIRSGSSGGVDVPLALGQTGNISSRLTVAGEVFRGFLRRLDDARLLLEVESRDSPSMSFANYTQRIRQITADRDKARREVLEQISARERVRLAAIDIASVAVEPLNALTHAVEEIEHANKMMSANLDAEILELRKRVVETRMQLYELKALVEGNFLSEARDTLHLRPLFGSVLRERYGSLLRSNNRVVIGEIPDVFGSVFLAKRFLRHLLGYLAPQEDADTVGFYLGSQVRFNMVVIRAEAPPLKLSVADHTRREVAAEIMHMMAESQGWDVEWTEQPDGQVLVNVGAPLAGGYPF